MSETALKLGVWGTKTTYGCPYCAFDSLHEDVALDHVYVVHRFEDQPKPANGGLYDSTGNLITAR